MLTTMTIPSPDEVDAFQTADGYPYVQYDEGADEITYNPCLFLVPKDIDELIDDAYAQQYKDIMKIKTEISQWQNPRETPYGMSISQRNDEIQRLQDEIEMLTLTRFVDTDEIHRLQDQLWILENPPSKLLQNPSRRVATDAAIQQLQSQLDYLERTDPYAETIVGTFGFRWSEQEMAYVKTVVVEADRSTITVQVSPGQYERIAKQNVSDSREELYLQTEVEQDRQEEE